MPYHVSIDQTIVQVYLANNECGSDPFEPVYLSQQTPLGWLLRSDDPYDLTGASDHNGRKNALSVS